MDPITLLAVTIASRYAKDILDDSGKKGVMKIWGKIRGLFVSSEQKELLQRFEANPHDEENKKAFVDALKEKLKKHHSFRADLMALFMPIKGFMHLGKKPKGGDQSFSNEDTNNSA